MLHSAPTTAANGTQEISPSSPPAMARGQLGKRISPKIPPKEGPPDTPSICGQASGLPSKACSTTPQAAMPPPMATPRSTRGRRAQKSISVSGFAKDKSCRARDRSRCTGPSRVQATIESVKSASSTPLTKIIFLRSRTFTTTSFIESAFGFREALRVNEPGDFFETFADTRSGPEDLVRLIGVDSVLPHSGNGLEIAPMFDGFAALRSHTGLDDHLRRFGHDVFVR